MRFACYGDSLTQGVPGSSYVARLRDRVPEADIHNHGLGGDTVMSLARRIRWFNLARPVDVSVLWIGINDLLVHLTPEGPTVKRLAGQVWAHDADEFRIVYNDLLDLLLPHTDRMLILPPLMIGEDLTSDWNQRVAEYALVVEDIARVRGLPLVDIRPRFSAYLADKTPSDYVPTSIFKTLMEVVTLRTDAQVDARAADRGLHVTLDGVHLNSVGASLVADAIADCLHE